MIVVDTSVLIDFFRGNDTPAVARLQRIERDEIPFRIPLICCQEVLQGARHERDWKRLEQYLCTQDLLWSDAPWATHSEAARIYFDCRRKGITIRSTIDCLIAQLVLEADDLLLHDDNDFDYVQEVRPLRATRR